VDNSIGGCSEKALLETSDIVRVPEGVDPVLAAGVLTPAVLAYTALHYHTRLCRGENCLIFNGASADGIVAIELAHFLGGKVFTTAVSAEEVRFLEPFVERGVIERIIDGSREDVVDTMIAETGALGVDVILGVPPPPLSVVGADEDEVAMTDETDDGDLRRLDDALQLLAPFGRWSVCYDTMQLDASRIRLLHSKSASIAFLNEQVWVCSGYQQGRFKHVLSDALDKVSQGIFTPHIAHTFSLDQIREAHRLLHSIRVGTIAIVPSSPQRGLEAEDGDE